MWLTCQSELVHDITAASPPAAQTSAFDTPATQTARSESRGHRPIAEKPDADPSEHPGKPYPSRSPRAREAAGPIRPSRHRARNRSASATKRSEEHTSELQSPMYLV